MLTAGLLATARRAGQVLVGPAAAVLRAVAVGLLLGGVVGTPVAEGRVEQAHDVDRVPADVDRHVHRQLNRVAGADARRTDRGALRAGVGVRGAGREGERPTRDQQCGQTTSANLPHGFLPSGGVRASARTGINATNARAGSGR